MIEHGLRHGVSLGGCFMPEGWILGAGAQGYTGLTNGMRNLGINPDEAWLRLWDAFITPDDIEQIKTIGFDHIRLPVHHTTPRSLITRLVDECGEVGLKVVIDLHGAPGGASISPITADYVSGTADLWDNDPSNRNKTIAWWANTAAAYKDFLHVQFDLVNEPFPQSTSGVTWTKQPDQWFPRPTFWRKTEMDRLNEFYAQILTEIRATGANNFVWLEGTKAAHQLDGLKLLDNNCGFSVHQYQADTTTGRVLYGDLENDQAKRLREHRAAANQSNAPLWLGEYGLGPHDYIERQLGWARDAGIDATCLWTWKTATTQRLGMRIGNGNSPVHFKLGKDAEKLMDALCGVKNGITASQAQTAWDQLCVNVNNEFCTTDNKLLDIVKRHMEATQ